MRWMPGDRRGEKYINNKYNTILAIEIEDQSNVVNRWACMAKKMWNFCKFWFFFLARNLCNFEGKCIIQMRYLSFFTNISSFRQQIWFVGYYGTLCDDVHVSPGQLGIAVWKQQKGKKCRNSCFWKENICTFEERFIIQMDISGFF